MNSRRSLVTVVRGFTMEQLTGQMMKQEGVTEHLKADQSMIWVGRMNSIRNRTEESVIAEIFNTL